MIFEVEVLNSFVAAIKTVQPKQATSRAVSTRIIEEMKMGKVTHQLNPIAIYWEVQENLKLL